MLGRQNKTKYSKTARVAFPLLGIDTKRFYVWQRMLHIIMYLILSPQYTKRLLYFVLAMKPNANEMRMQCKYFDLYCSLFFSSKFDGFGVLINDYEHIF